MCARRAGNAPLGLGPVKQRPQVVKDSLVVQLQAACRQNAERVEHLQVNN